MLDTSRHETQPFYEHSKSGHTAGIFVFAVANRHGEAIHW